MFSPIPQHPSRRLLYLWRIYLSVILAIVLALGLWAAFTSDMAVLIPLSVTVTSILVYQLVYLPVLWESRTYTRCRGILRIEKGVIIRRTIVIPRSQLQFISLRRHLHERIFNLTTLVFHTTGGKIYLSGLEAEDAENLKENFSRRFEG